ncbi:MAG: hypothetical protein ACYTAU_14315 [Planctomycetota bacterium]|jgi:hypothetical protein
MTSGEPVCNRVVRALALVALSAAGGAAARGEVTVFEITSDHAWGYRCGVKQPLGAYKDGLSVHQISRSNYPEGTDGNPDYLFWVDEIAGTHGVSLRPTGDFDGYVTNPGGMVSFSSDGTIWYAYGGRAQDLPMDLYSSVQPSEPTAFTKRLDDLDLFTGSTTPCINVHDPKLLFFWRHANSGNAFTGVWCRRYDINGTFDAPEIELELSHSVDHEVHGLVGIEQLWTRHDPRFGYTFLTWQFFKTSALRFGSNPFLYTDDNGDTWRTADGTAWTQFPIYYSDITDTLVPFDHVEEGGSTDWLVSDIGVSPHGTFWITLRSLYGAGIDFWRFDGASWSSERLASIDTCKPHACGVTRDYLVFAYSDLVDDNVLKARLSADDGLTWTEPIVLDVLDEALDISWVSFVQPADGYPDNAARFFYGYSRVEDGNAGLRYRNNIRWTRYDAGPTASADIDGDGVVGILDFLLMLAEWGPCVDCGVEPCLADLDGDCEVGINDFLLLLADWD